MEEITKKQYEVLMSGEIDKTLSENIKLDIEYLKTVLLREESGMYFVECVEVDELCREEFLEVVGSGEFIRFS